MTRSQRVRRLRQSASALAVLILMAACGPSSTMGQLAGHVHTKGGRDAKVRPATAKLTATPIASTKVTYTVDTASDGAFSVDLPPGAYLLTGSLTTQITGGQTSPQDVYISTGKTTTVEVYAIYP